MVKAVIGIELWGSKAEGCSSVNVQRAFRCEPPI